jgi:hypothetical protein
VVFNKRQVWEVAFMAQVRAWRPSRRLLRTQAEAMPPRSVVQDPISMISSPAGH